MTFLHLYMLGGLALLGLPVLVHLIMRQKPRRLPFPAFRFLRQKHLVNRRRMRLQHLLLLLLRMAALAALCFALAQPRLFLPRAWANAIGLGGERPVAAAFVFDLSHSMECRHDGLGRLDESRQLALERFQSLPEGSRVAVFDTGEDAAAGDDWIATPAEVRGRINKLRLRPVQAPLVRQINAALGLLGDVKAEDGGEPPDRRVYVFSDRTTTSWDAVEARRLKVPDGVSVTFVDVGVDEPRDLSIDKVTVEPQVIAPGGVVRVRCEVRATGADFDALLLCHLDEPPPLEPVKVDLKAGTNSSEYSFALTAPALTTTGAGAKQAAHQVVVKLTTPDDRPLADDLAHDNVRFATFLVRDDPRRVGRRVLTLTDDETITDPRKSKAAYWWAYLTAYRKAYPAAGFECDLASVAEADRIDLAKLQTYRSVCLFETAKLPSGKFLEGLAKYVADGGGLILVPPGDELTNVADWNGPLRQHGLLPAPLKEKKTAPPPGFAWKDFDSDRPHEILSLFLEWKKRGVQANYMEDGRVPVVNRYWQTEPTPGSAIAYYEDGEASPAPALVVKGNVVEFTTVLSRRELPDEAGREWNNYWLSSFGQILAQRSSAFLAHDGDGERLNFRCGEPVTLSLPAGLPRRTYLLDAPDLDLAESDRLVVVEAGAKTVAIRATGPGNYVLFDPDRRPVAAFSLNVGPEEANLERLAKEDVEAALGKGSVLSRGPAGDLGAALRALDRGRTEADPAPAKIDPMPLLMVLVLAALAVEGVLANRFYRRPAADPSPAGVAA
jgi:hypothetical protein